MTVRRRILVVLAGLGTFMTTAAPSLPPPTPPPANGPALEQRFKVSDHWRPELASALIEPRDGCNDPAGRMLISSHDHLSWRDLDGGAVTNVDLPYPTKDGAWSLYGDPQMTRRANGDFIYLRSAWSYQPVKPAPPWYSWVHTYRRGVLLVWVSHCGDTWSPLPTIDPQSQMQGKCAWPHGLIGNDSGGFDRANLYSDPYSGTTYVVANCVGGTSATVSPDGVNHYVRAQGFLSLAQDAKSWQDLAPLDFNAAVGITSTSDGRLYILRCETGAPVLHVSTDGGHTLVAYTLQALYPNQTCNPPNYWNKDGADIKLLKIQVLTNDYQLGRVGPHSIRVAFGATDAGRTTIHLMNVNFDPPGTYDAATPGVHSIGQVVTVSASGDANIGHFGLTDTNPLSLSNDSNLVHTATLHWVQYSPGSDMQSAWGEILRGASNDATSQELSQIPWKYQTSGAGNWVGDYSYGAFAVWDGACRFLLPWTTSDNTLAGDNVDDHYTIWNDTDCATTTLPGATLAPPTLPPAVTAAATPVSKNGLPKVGPSGVKSANVVFDTCTLQSDNTWRCPLTATFTLTPGPPSTIHWQVAYTLFYNCQLGVWDDNVQGQSDIPTTLSQTSVSATGELVFPYERAPNPATVAGIVPDPNHTSRGHVVISDSSLTSPDATFVSNNTQCGKP